MKTEDRLLPLLLEAEQALDQELSLSSLAARFGASEYHFHRLFAAAVGETPKKHFDRMRIERAALLLATSELCVTEIGLAVGFRNLETFSRNYKRALGVSPSAYRRMAKAAQAERLANVDFFASPDYVLSRTHFERLPRMEMLAVRHLGEYGALNESFAVERHPWKELVDWAGAHGAAVDLVLVGIFYDDPTMTPGPQQRCDVCLPLRGAAKPSGRVRRLPFAGGLYAIARYVGSVEHLLSAFRGLADDIRRSPSYAFREGAALEFLRAPNVGGREGVHCVDVCFPVSRRARRERDSKKRQDGPAATR